MSCCFNTILSSFLLAMAEMIGETMMKQREGKLGDDPMSGMGTGADLMEGTGL